MYHITVGHFSLVFYVRNMTPVFVRVSVLLSDVIVLYAHAGHS
jgi:hypothetical protein